VPSDSRPPAACLRLLASLAAIPASTPTGGEKPFAHRTFSYAGCWIRTSENTNLLGTSVNKGKEKGRTLLLRSITVVARHSHPVQAIVYVVVWRVGLGVLDALTEVYQTRSVIVSAAPS
jgi:hypothetical protein